MNIDELISAIQSTSPDDSVVLTLCDLLRRWKNDDADVQNLEILVERFIGNTWIESDEVHRKVYRLWSEFRCDAIRGVQEMTMRERLVCFGLMRRFEAAENEIKRNAILAKLADFDRAIETPKQNSAP